MSAGLYVSPLSFIFRNTDLISITTGEIRFQIEIKITMYISEKYTRGLIVGRTRKIHSDISPTLLLTFTGVVLPFLYFGVIVDAEAGMTVHSQR